MEWYTYMQDASEMYKTEEKRVFARARALAHMFGSWWLNKLNSMHALLNVRHTPIHNKQSKMFNACNSNKSTTIAKSLSNKTPATDE